MHNIEIYLPIDRRLALSRGESLPTTTQGIALFADISGFTPLTAAYTDALGPRQGAEELMRQINQVYEALISEVHRFRGAIIYFSGDAITCWFDDQGEGETAALRATACALAMQARMEAFVAVSPPKQASSSNEPIAITIKIGMAAGPARRFQIGDPNIQQLDVLMGETLSRMAAAEKLARPGQIVVSAELIQPGIETTSLDDTNYVLVQGLKQTITPTPWPPLPDEHQLTDDLAQTWLLQPVYDKIRSGAEQFLAELRLVVPLFLRFGGLDCDNDPDVGEKLDVYLSWVQQIVGRFEGYVLQVTVGDKGSYLYTSFGAPIAHEDDADRALRAALALCNLPPHLDFIESFQIGISRGPMRVGAYGGSSRHTYGAIGHETNIAARLMSYAGPGQIVVSQRVVDALSRKATFQFNALGELNLKGSPRLVPAYIVEPATDGRGTLTQFAALPFTSPLFGRQAEQQQLKQHLTHFLAGHSRLVIIEGDAGIGKSRLVQTLLAEARPTAVRPLLGEASAIEQASPYYAWRHILGQLFQLETLSPNNLAERHTHVLQQLPDDPTLVELAPLLNPILGLDLPENELTAAMTGLSRANKTQELVTAILQQAAHTTPLFIIVEDAHWLDSTSWALLEAVHETVKPLLLLLAIRPLEGESPPLLSHIDNQWIRLKPLSSDEALNMVCQRLGVSTLPQSVASFIMGRAEGHPFFCEELAYALRDNQLIHVQDGVCQVAPDAGDLSRLNFPTTIEGVITSRIDRLSPAHQLVIKVSSVIGRLFAFNTLQAVHPTTPSNLRQSLGDLDRLDITQLQTSEPELVYVFKHIITQQVAYNLLLYSQRRQLHQQVAEWYERTQPHDLDNSSPLLAYHWYNALDISNPDPALAAKALHYGEIAGDRAVRSYANQEAVRLFAYVKEVAAHLTDESLIPKIRQAHWELQLGEAYLGLGQLLESRHHFEQCLILLGWPVPEIGSKMGLSLVRQILWRIGWKRPHTPTPEQRLSLQKAARAYELLGQIYYLTNLPVPTLYAMIRGLNLAEQIGEGTPELARAYANMSGAVALIPLFKKSLAYEANAWQAMSSLQDITTKTYLHLITTVHKINIANWDEAESGFDKGLSLATQLGDRRTAGFCISGKAHIALYRGYFRESMALFEQLELLGEAAHDVTHWGTALGGKGACYMRQGHWPEALAHIEKSLTFSVEAGNALAEWNNRARFGLTQFYAGQIDTAMELANANFNYAMQAPHTAFANTTIYSDLLTTLLLLWEQAPQPYFPTTTKALCKRYKQYTRIFPFALPTYYRLNGWREWLNGNPKAAFKSWQRALSQAQRLRMPHDAGMSHYEIGRHLPATDPQRTHHLNEASRILTELEATHDLKRLQGHYKR